MNQKKHFRYSQTPLTGWVRFSNGRFSLNRTCYIYPISWLRISDLIEYPFCPDIEIFRLLGIRISAFDCTVLNNDKLFVIKAFSYAFPTIFSFVTWLYKFYRSSVTLQICTTQIHILLVFNQNFNLSINLYRWAYSSLQ